MNLPIQSFLIGVLLALSGLFPARADGTLRAHPENPYILEFRGRPTVLRTFGEHYSSVINEGFDYLPYLDVMKRDGMNLTRVFLVGFKENISTPTLDPLAPAPAEYLQPWLRDANQGLALDGLGKWDFSVWNEDYFNRLEAFVQACSDRGIVVELTLFSTNYTELQWADNPFNPANNVQGYGPASRFDCFRPGNPDLLAVQEAAVRRIVNRLNRFDNIFFGIQNEPFWNEPEIRDDEEVAFHESILGYLRDEESLLPNRHLVAHNFPQQIASLSDGYDIISDHYPAAVPNTTIAGTEALLRNHYAKGRILSMGETNPLTPLQTRLETWMFLIGGGGICNGLDYANLIYTAESEAGDSELGRSMRGAVRSVGTYLDALHLVGLRRNPAWFAAGIPAGATLQAMANPGQQYVAYLHHGSFGTEDFQIAYDPIDVGAQTVIASVDLPEGNWRAVWTRPEDLTELNVEEFAHGGGIRQLAPVAYQADVALRIDRTGEGDLTPPPPPALLQTESGADGSVSLEWIASNASDLAEYRIYRDNGLLVSVSQDNLVFTDTTTTPGIIYEYVVTAVDTQNNESLPGHQSSVLSELRNRPFGGTPHPIPGTIQAEDFDAGGIDIAFHDLTPGNLGGEYRSNEDVDIDVTTDGNGGFDVTSTEAGEWLEYTVDVAESGVYRLVLRIFTTGDGDEFGIVFDGVPVATLIPSAEITDEWQTLVVPETVLAAGEHILRLSIQQTVPETTAGRINWIAFEPIIKTGPIADAGPDFELTDEDFDGHAIATLNAAASTAGDSPISNYAWSTGGSTIASGIAPEVRLALGEHRIELTVTDEFGLQATDELIVRIVPADFANGGFEAGFDAWTTTGNVSIHSAPPYVPAEGTQLAAFNTGQSTPNGVLSQTFSTSPGRRYQVVFTMGLIAYNNLQQQLRVEVSGNASLFSQNHTINRLNKTIIRWEEKSFFFTADSGSATLSFRDISTTTNSLDLTLDKVRVIPQITRTLQVAANPFAGVPIQASPADNSGLGEGNTEFSRFYPNAVTINLSAPPTRNGYRFEKWLKNGNELATSTNISLVMDADHTLTAVYVEGPPVIVTPPSNATILVGTGAIFSVIAEGTGTLGYQWRFNGVDIPGANSSTFEITDAAEEDTGNYDVIVSNAVGPVTSSPAVLTVLPEMTVTLLNGSFEEGLTGWTASGNLNIQTNSPYQATDGARLVAFNSGQSTPNGLVSQNIITIPGQVYQLSFDMGVLAYNNYQQRLQVEITGNSRLVTQTYVTNRINNIIIRWESKQLTFTADTTTTTLAFRDVSTTSSSLDLTLDNIRIIPQIQRTLTISSVPASAGISLSPADNNGLTGGPTVLTRTYQNEATVDVAAAPVAGYRFDRWLSNGVEIGTSASIRLVMNANFGITAVYAEHTPVLPSGLRILPVGDSITYGYNGSHAGYRGPLYGLLAPDAPDFQYLGTKTGNPGALPSAPINQQAHQGLPSYTIDEITNNLDGLDDARFRLHGSAERDPSGGYWLTGGNGTGRGPMHPDIITLLIGTNDLPSPSGVEVRLRNLLNKITTLRPSTRLLVAKITPAPSHAPAVSSYNTIIGNVVEEFRTAGNSVYLVDLNTGFPANGLDSDNLHPNNAGFDWMALQWQAAILSAYPVVDPGSPPVITLEPVNVTAAVGAAATFRVTAAGAAPLSYEWRFNGTPIGGGNSTTFVISSVIDDNAGAYEVVVSNAAGFVTSRPATLTVTPAPTMTAVANIVNGSFENGFNGWSASGNVAVRSSIPPYSATNGTNLANFNSSNSTPNGTLSQPLVTTPGVAYVIAFDIGVLAFNTLAQRLKITCTGQASLLDRRIDVIGTGNGTSRWLSQSFPFVADSSTTILTFRDQSTATNAIDLLLDNVRLTTSAQLSAAAPAPKSAPIPTMAMVTPPPAELGSASLTGAPGNFRITLPTAHGGTFVLEISEDLIHWKQIDEINLDGPGVVEFSDALPSASSGSGRPQRGFYRIGRLPDGLPE